VFVGELATFNVLLGFTATPGLAGETLANLTLTMTSGDGQTQSGSSASFAYALPGLYTVTAQGSALTSGLVTTLLPIYSTGTECHEVTDYFLGIPIGSHQECENVVILVGYQTRVDTVYTVTALYGTTQVNVVQASIIDPGETPAAVPEPASIALLGIGIVALVTARRRKQRTSEL